MSSVSLSLVTVNYKSSAKIKALRDTLLSNPPKVSWEWLVVDNFSSEREVKKLRALLENTPNTHLIELAQNRGYGVGNGEGVRFAAGEYLAIVNPDIEILPKSFDLLVEQFKKNKKAGICVPVLQSHTGEILKNTRRFPNAWKIIKRRIFGYKPAVSPSEVRSVEWSQGSFWVLRKSLFEELGGFDDRFFLFFEDTDFCRRVRQKGLQVLQIPTARAIHSPNRLSGGNLFLALFRKTFWIHIHSAIKYFWKWR